MEAGTVSIARKQVSKHTAPDVDVVVVSTCVRPIMELARVRVPRTRVAGSNRYFYVVLLLLSRECLQWHYAVLMGFIFGRGAFIVTSSLGLSCAFVLTGERVLSVFLGLKSG